MNKYLVFLMSVDHFDILKRAHKPKKCEQPWPGVCSGSATRGPDSQMGSCFEASQLMFHPLNMFLVVKEKLLECSIWINAEWSSPKASRVKMHYSQLQFNTAHTSHNNINFPILSHTKIDDDVVSIPRYVYISSQTLFTWKYSVFMCVTGIWDFI